MSSDAVDRLRTILRALPDPILVVDPSGKLTPLNPPGEQMAEAAANGATGVQDKLALIADMARGGLFGDPVPIGLRVDGIYLIYEATARVTGKDVLIVCRDVSADTSVREVLLESRQRYKQLVEIGSDFVWECDDSGAFSFISEPGAFSYPPHLLVGRQPTQFMVETDGHPGWPNRTPEPVRDHHVRVAKANGEIVTLALNAGPVRDDRNHQIGVRGTARAVQGGSAPRTGPTEKAPDRIGAIMQAMRSEWHPADMLRNGVVGVVHGFAATGCAIIGGNEGDQWQVLAECGELPDSATLQACPDKLHDRRTLRLDQGDDGEIAVVALHCQGHRNSVLVARRRSNDPAWLASDLDALSRLDAPCGIAVQQALELKRLTRLSRSDSLTGLLNRRAFLLELTAALARASRHQTTGALIYLDLNHFKRLNDRYGHETGNQALIGVANILSSAIRPYDLAARMGGDEFVVWLEDISGRDAGRSARRIADAIADWSGRLAQDTELGAAIGVAMFDPDTPESPEDLIGRADSAMYKAKRTPDKAVVVARRRRLRPRPATRA